MIEKTGTDEKARWLKAISPKSTKSSLKPRLFLYFVSNHIFHPPALKIRRDWKISPPVTFLVFFSRTARARIIAADFLTRVRVAGILGNLGR